MGNAGEQITGNITSGITVGTLALKTIDFVQEQLPLWRDDPNRSNEQAENKLNLQLCKFLDHKARNDFPMIRFDHEEYQKGRSSVDISASPATEIGIGASFYSTIYDPILVFECKRLPAPSNDREKEYITGGADHNGGIQRFKLGLYGANHNIAAMIGYLQKESASYWHEKINSWIIELGNVGTVDDCVWKTSEILDQLQENPLKGIARCKSTHVRSGSEINNEITLHHLWITMKLN